MATATPAMRAAEQRGFFRQAALDTGYCLAGAPIAVVRFAVLLIPLCLGSALAIVFLGLPVLALTLHMARAFADVERLRLRWVLNKRVRRPRYVSGAHRAGMRRLLTPLTDAQSWLDVLYGVFGLVPALVGFCVTAAWWAAGLAGSLYFLWGWSLPPAHVWPDAIGVPHTFLFEAATNTAIGVILLAGVPFVARAMAMVNASMARLMLTHERVTALEERIDELAGSRDAAVSAEAAALRRLERDLHDGPQQRLVRLTMDLSLARRRMRTDPEAARRLLDEAIGHSRETLEELRALSRGIAPPVLADRGLPAALSALAGRSMVPVELDVTLYGEHRLPPVAESTAYFVVAEALTNVAKHSGAGRCQVRIARDGALVNVRIFDDGGGGAHAAKGHGLAGLSDRVRAVDGRLEVDSPAGGPTVVTAVLPCG
jgi:signal transduction histidine kinase